MQDETTPMPEESQQFLETEMAPSPESESPPWLFDFETQEEQFFEEESAGTYYSAGPSHPLV